MKTRLSWIYPMADSSSTQNKIISCNKIIENSLFEIGSFKDIYVDIENGWHTDNDSRILRRELHTNYFLEDFSHAFLVTDDKSYLDASFKLLKNWIETFPAEKMDKIDPLAYHDEGTAIRLLFWFKYYYKVYDFLDDYQKEFLNKHIQVQSNILLDDEFYSGANNHGMFQDIAIIAYTMFESESFYESDIFEKSMKRIFEYFNEVFTNEGIHKEHAPSYHMLVLHNLKHVILSLRKAKYTDGIVDFLENIYEKGEKYIVNVTMPNFKLPRISDSTETDMTKTNRYKNLFESENYQFVTSGGDQGIEPQDRIIPYPESGYFIARNGWEKSSNYLLFLASYHMHYHKHTDDLSFILYKNQPIFIDSGPHSYNYKNEITRYAYSSFAHSTLILNNTSLPRTDYKFDDVYIKDYETDENYFSVTGVNSRFKNAIHERKISGDIEQEQYEVTDVIDSENKNQYKILFQISGQLDLYRHGSIISIFSKNSKIGELELLHTKNCDFTNIDIVSGQHYPFILGYEFPKKEVVEKSNTVIINTYNNDNKCEIKTQIRLKDFKITGGATYKDKYSEIQYGDVSYIYENNNRSKLAVVFSQTDNSYKYGTIDVFDSLSAEYNLLIIKDNQSKAGTSFIAGKTNSTIERDITEIIFKHVQLQETDKNQVMFIGKSKGGFASLYYGLRLNIKNIFAISPLTLIGDYYTRLEKLNSVSKTLSGGNDIGDAKYLNDILFNIDLKDVSSNINIAIGELDYHFKKHINPLKEWCESNNIPFSVNVYKDKEFKDTDKFIPDYIKTQILNLEV